MKKFYALLFISSLWACTDDLDNTNPNEPTLAIPTEIFNFGVKSAMDYTRNRPFSLRMTLPWVQYLAPISYTTEGLYQFRDEDNKDNWKNMYTTAHQFKRIIDLNTDPKTKSTMADYGDNDGQIAVSRIMLCYLFQITTDTWGDAPYYSYGNKDADFQALDPNNLSPKYAPQEKIYKDLLKELKEAQDTLENVSKKILLSGDRIYNGDAAKWRKFANSLRLRVANRIKRKDPTLAEKEIQDAISKGTFASNADNAGLTYEDNDRNGTPIYRDYFVDNRTDLAASYTFIDLLKGEGGKNPFNGVVDPRLFRYAAPYTVESTAKIKTREYKDSAENYYRGLIYGVKSPQEAMKDPDKNDIKYSYPSYETLKPNATEYLMTYAELQFILAEYKSDDMTHYKNGVRASLEQWGVPVAQQEGYLKNISKNVTLEKIITQKYIALYMQPHEAWAEYRRTTFPKTLVLPGEEIKIPGLAETHTFKPSIGYLKDLPSRVNYPSNEQALNGNSYREAVGKLSGGDKMDSKFWWLQ